MYQAWKLGFLIVKLAEIYKADLPNLCKQMERWQQIKILESRYMM